MNLKKLITWINQQWGNWKSSQSFHISGSTIQLLGVTERYLWKESQQSSPMLLEVQKVQKDL